MRTTWPLPRIFSLAMTAVAVISLVAMGAAWSINRYQQLQSDLEYDAAHYLEEQKTCLKNRVENAVVHVRYARDMAELRLQNALRMHTEEAVSIIDGICRTNTGRVPPQEIQQRIIETLRPMAFNHGHGRTFILRRDGMNLLSPFHPEQEGKSLLQALDATALAAVQGCLTLASTSGSGFASYPWATPGHADRSRLAAAYVTTFEPYDWIVGTGDLLDNYIRDMQRETIDYLAQIRFGVDGYLFGSKTDGSPLFTNGVVTRGGANLRDLTDPDGIKIFQEQLRGVSNKDGGFVRYSWRKLMTDDPIPKIVFVKRVPEWDWIIGSGVYLDEIKANIAARQKTLKRDMRRGIAQIGVISLIVLACITLATASLSHRLRRELAVFIESFSHSGDKGAHIDETRLELPELRELAASANAMSRKRDETEAALRHSEGRLRALFEAATDVAFTIVDIQTPEPIVLEFSPGAEALYGWSRSEMLGRSVARLHRPEDAARFPEIRRRIMEEEKAYRDEVTLVRRSGEHFPGMLTIYTLRDERGEPYAALAVSIDISDRKRLERVLLESKEHAEAANRAKSEFLANMSHEIRTPMNGVMGMLQLIGLSPLTAEQHSFLEAALRSCRSLTGLLNDILDLSRIEAGMLTLRQEPFMLAEVLHSVEDMFRLSATEKGLKLRFSLAEGVPSTLLGDSARLRQVLFNLVGNALKFTPAGAIAVSAMPLDTVPTGQCRIAFAVTDTGIGIPADKQTLIFEPFTQVEGSYTRAYQGAGLGLQIVQRLVRLMGGEVTVASEPGKGTSFRFTLAFLPAPDEQSAPPPPLATAVPPSPLRILVVEDDPVNMLTATRLLERLGHSVEGVANGALALETLRQDRFDCVFMDVQMPVMDGLEATRRLRNEDAFKAVRDTPVIAVTAHAMTGDRERFLEAGMQDYVAKPFDMETLGLVLRRVALARPSG
ncbi:MAG: cache domain-containing protein [Desulfovibrionaceae bacterium]